MSEKLRDVSQVVAEFKSEWPLPNIGYDGSSLDFDQRLAQYDWLTKTLAADREAVARAERERIVQQMHLHIPAQKAKKPMSYNEGVTSGWYAAKAFIQTLTQPPTDKTGQRYQIAKVRNGLWEVRWEDGAVSAHSIQQGAEKAVLRNTLPADDNPTQS